MENYSQHSESFGSEVCAEMQSLIENAGRLRKFSKNEIIYRQGDTAAAFCYLKKGKVKVFMTSPDGMEKTLNTPSHGEIFGEGAFFDKKPRVSSAKAITNCELVMLDEVILYNLISRQPVLAFELLKILSNRIRLLSAQLDSMTFMQADERIARYLLDNAVDNSVGLSHEEIATAVGASRVTVSKTLSRLAKSGVIATQYRKIVIKDRDKLSELRSEN